MQLFGAADEFVAVHLRHEEVAENEVEGARCGPLKDLEGFPGGVSRDDAITASFEEKATDRENLLIVIYAENRFFGAHAVSLLPDAVL